MANRKAHERFNFIFGIITISVLFYNEISIYNLISFSTAFFFATYIFSPDSDLIPSKKALILRPFFYPYSMFFKHRGISHKLILGTLTRIIYIVVLMGIFLFIVKEVQGVENYFKFLKNFFINFSLELPLYRAVVWFFLGHIVADLFHITLDIV